jgi:hypothetical protein
MNLYPETSMGLRPNHPSSLNGLNINSPQRSRLPPGIGDELLRGSPSDNSLVNTASGNSSSPLRQKFSLPAFLPSPSRFIQQLPASPASLLLSPLIKKNDNEQQSNSSSFLLNNDDETNLIEQIDHYFIRRQQYLRHNIDVSLNISKWILENMIFYSVETLRYVSKLNQSKDEGCFYHLDVKLNFKVSLLMLI